MKKESVNQNNFYAVLHFTASDIIEISNSKTLKYPGLFPDCK